MSESPDTAPGGSDRSAEGNGVADTSAPDAAPRIVDPDDEVIDEASEESFPASDSPSSWAGPASESR